MSEFPTCHKFKTSELNSAFPISHKIRQSAQQQIHLPAVDCVGKSNCNRASHHFWSDPIAHLTPEEKTVRPSFMMSSKNSESFPLLPTCLNHQLLENADVFLCRSKFLFFPPNLTYRSTPRARNWDSTSISQSLLAFGFAGLGCVISPTWTPGPAHSFARWPAYLPTPTLPQIFSPVNDIIDDAWFMRS